MMRVSSNNRFVIPLCVTLFAGCSEAPQERTTLTLSRPGPLALVCAQKSSGADGGMITPVAESRCASLAQQRVDAGTAGSATGVALYGFVANTERGDVSLFKVESDRSLSRLVDLDPGVPGQSGIAVGRLPSDMKTTSDGCRVVVANALSCDMSIIDTNEILQIAEQSAGAHRRAAATSHIVPHTARGPLGVAPQSLVTMPSSKAASSATAACSSGAPYRAWVTFPRCHLLAEIDLNSGRLVQGYQFTKSGVVRQDDPICPKQCARTTGYNAPPSGDLNAPGIVQDSAITVADAGLDAQAVADASSPTDLQNAPSSNVQPYGLAISEAGDRLFVSAFDANFITVLDVATTTHVVTRHKQIVLSGAELTGTTAIALSPPTKNIGRFIYTIGSDRTVRIISTDLERECEANADSSQLQTSTMSLDVVRCLPVSPQTPRRVTASSSGLEFAGRIPLAVTFVNVVPSANAPDAGSIGDASVSTTQTTGLPLTGVFAIIAMSDGWLYVVNVEDQKVITSSATKIAAPQLPHRVRNNWEGDKSDARVPDAQIVSISGAGSGSVPVVVSKEGTQQRLGDGITMRTVREEMPSSWNMIYEDLLVTRRSGRLAIDGAQLFLDDLGATYCRSGVLGRSMAFGRIKEHGDIVTLSGCQADTDCGGGQVCRRPVAISSDTGLCLDASRQDTLFQQCRAFLQNKPDFLVVQAADHHLTLDALPAEMQRVYLQNVQPATGCTDNTDCDDNHYCALQDRVVKGRPNWGVKRGQCFRLGCDQDADCDTGHVCTRPIDGGPKVCTGVPLPLEEGPSCKIDADCRPKTLPATCQADRDCLSPFAECIQLNSADTTKTCVDRQMRCTQLPRRKNVCTRISPCFTDLNRYEVRSGRSFILDATIRRPDPRAIEDRATGQCGVDAQKSALLQRRVPVALSNYPVLLDQRCIASGATTPTVLGPNPCVEQIQSGYTGYTQKDDTTGVLLSPSAVAPATVLRMSNESLSLTLGLSHLAEGRTIVSQPSPTDAGVPDATTADTGATTLSPYRMPERGLTFTFATNSGYAPLTRSFSLDNTGALLAFPINLVAGPDGVLYVVDMGDRSVSTGYKGLVLGLDASAITTYFVLR